MHSESTGFGYAGVSSGSAPTLAAIDDVEMDNENENNTSGVGGDANLTMSALDANTYNPDFEVNNTTSIDVETYISGFTGPMRVTRLVFLAEHCPAVRVDALRLALSFVLETFNTQLYTTTYKQYNDALLRLGQQAQQAPLAFDSAWVETTNKKAALKLEKLDADLKSAKSLAVKDYIRRGQEDLADHFLDMGDLTNALKCYSRSRDYCSNNKHIVALCLNVIRVSIYLKNWSYVLSYVNKVQSALELYDPSFAAQQNKEDAATRCKINCAVGLAELNRKRYNAAALYFLSISFENFNYSDIITPNNVVIYGSLCALATLDRSQLQQQVIQSSSFKSFLELEPQIRDVLHKFNESKYAACLKLLDQMKEQLLLDMYLSPHVNPLYARIRRRAMRQYFIPFKSANLVRMAQAFNTTVAPLEEELIELILDGQIQARIDSQNKILYAKDIDKRSVTFEESIKMGKEYEKLTRHIILRTLIIKHNICVKAPHIQSHSNDTSAPQISR